VPAVLGGVSVVVTLLYNGVYLYMITSKDTASSISAGCLDIDLRSPARKRSHEVDMDRIIDNRCRKAEDYRPRVCRFVTDESIETCVHQSVGG